ncbi:phosphopantetheine adenylyltransferase [Haemophilus influenzae biotype aegyptius]|uniref:pantetheine-phosphate adenylyltransferase n=1 Tax=Haemophilus influenzae TaxID=727 RepID=UPI0001F3718B|nr:pantetheine-phosphate adenylyltransferase [Haemophilus influenzae]QEQ62394.1 pantetheine-phosphate adenylyltransferase [Haemophilus influenzae biotype aegyptius]QEQ63892.1 pantetheine-phosphate adenylyltransferase [Haemophilus influenzae biotype aegyptius]QEQ65958.1 pantetheine-phosphate adenylyltransferase [Haemophilus influenzae biotype aegyptius]TMQ36881.1 phosphopantetheine adenylyltransferase [Haemophilus influenzae biotype aegyptius]TMQ37176.1 phosphopantetheine adenylyltransferase [H
MTSVIYPGTFDPITNGHLDIIERSAVIFPRVLVSVANSPSKKPLFSLDERVELVRQSVVHLSNVEVFGFSDLLANVIKQHNISAIIRGVRTTTDFEYELQLAALNRLLTKGVDSLFFPPVEKWAFVSSSIVREIYLHGGDVAELVPVSVFNALKAR